MLLPSSQGQRHPYHFVPLDLKEKFERIAVSVYMDAARNSNPFPVLSRSHFFRSDSYGVAEGLYDFINEIFCNKLERNQVYPGKSEDWTEEIWESVELDMMEAMGYLESAMLDDLYENWNRQKMIFIDEHRTMSELLNIVHCSIQEVW